MKSRNDAAPKSQLHANVEIEDLYSARDDWDQCNKRMRYLQVIRKS